jgi:hypothetical protein
MTVLGGVLAMLALFAGFALTDASRTHLTRLDPAARGMLVDGERLDNRQYLVWAAVRRAGAAVPHNGQRLFASDPVSPARARPG